MSWCGKFENFKLEKVYKAALPSNGSYSLSIALAKEKLMSLLGLAVHGSAPPAVVLFLQF